MRIKKKRISKEISSIMRQLEMHELDARALLAQLRSLEAGTSEGTHVVDLAAWPEFEALEMTEAEALAMEAATLLHKSTKLPRSVKRRLDGTDFKNALCMLQRYRRYFNG